MKYGVWALGFGALLGAGCADVLGLDFDGYEANQDAAASSGHSGGAGGASSAATGTPGGAGGTPDDCNEGEVDCGGSCALLDSDPQHCGACNHGCFGGECQDGVCQPVTITAGDDPTGIVVVGSSLFWLDGGPNGEVMRFDLPDGPRQSLKTHGDAGLHDLASDGADLYYTADATNEVWRLSFDGAAEVLIGTPSKSPGAIALGGPWVTWVGGAGLNSELRRAHKDGTGGELIANQANVADLDADDDYFYFGIDNTSASVYRRLHMDGVNLGIAGDQDHPRSVRVRTTMAYWSTLDGFVRRRSVDGAGAIVDVAMGQAGPTALHLDADGVYWINADSGGIGFAPLQGGDAILIASNEDDPRALATDATSVYWTNHGDDQIRRVAKPIDAASP